MKIQIDNYRYYLDYPKDEITNLHQILIRILQSEVLISNIDRVNNKLNTKGIKSADIKKIINLILINYISNSNSNQKSNHFSIQQSHKHQVYQINHEGMNICLKFQTANWAVLYKDFFQFVNDPLYQKFDHIIYLVPDKSLCKYLSAGTVNYENTIKFIEKYSNGLKNNFSIFGVNISS